MRAEGCGQREAGRAQGGSEGRRERGKRGRQGRERDRGERALAGNGPGARRMAAGTSAGARAWRSSHSPHKRSCRTHVWLGLARQHTVHLLLGLRAGRKARQAVGGRLPRDCSAAGGGTAAARDGGTASYKLTPQASTGPWHRRFSCRGRRTQAQASQVARGAHLAQLVWIVGQQGHGPGEHRPCGLMPRHQHGQQVVAQLVSV